MKRGLTLALIGIFLVIAGAVGGISSLSILQKESAQSEGAYQTQQVGGQGGARSVLSLTSATTTPCAIPVTATSSIQHFALTVSTATSSAGTFTLGTSTTPYATSTTAISTFVVAANNQYTYTWNGGVNNDVVYPGTWIVAGMTNGSSVNYGYTYIGSCSAVIIPD